MDLSRIYLAVSSHSCEIDIVVHLKAVEEVRALCGMGPCGTK